jgi:hypothetical protein
VGSAGISTLDYVFFDSRIVVRNVSTHLAPKVSHAALSAKMIVPFGELGIENLLCFEFFELLMI